ncbi:AAA-domain-containing protein [Ramicandelaber brevisporus]|nr:AAA-domain-containing protein [Ramicandelaber brevisporus]
MVDYALLRPEIFQQYGLRPPRGVLLVGPSGTGKTLIASAVVAESGVRHFVINGADVVGKYYGEAEQRLRNVFEEAVIYGPSIIYIDEIDALCPRRDNSTNEQDKRIVATLLTLMDGVEGDDDSTKNKKPFFVIAATNRPNALDDALRRPGRFDREIDVGIPPPADRVSIMQTLMARHPHTLSDGELSDIALACHGFTGADLSAMIKEAGLIAIHRHLDSSVEQPTDSLFITAADISSAKARIVPSAMRQVSVEVPKVYWSDIGGQSDIKQRMRESIEWPLRHPERFTRLGIKPPKGILMYGPPGCSKTLTAKALATESGLNFIAVKGPELFSKWVGESEKAVRAVFQRARQASPAIVFFDEIDAIATARSGATSGGSGGGNGGSGGGNSVSDRVLSQLLVELDGIEPLVNVLVVAATNRPDVLDPALLRPGRIDRILYVGPPDVDARSEIFKIRFKKTMVADDVDAMELAQMTDGFSGAEIVSVCQEAAMAALEEDISAQAVCKRHFIKAIANTPKRITPDMVAFYDRFRKQSGLNEI